MKVMKRCVAGVLALAVCATVIGGSGNIQAAAKPKLSKKSIVLKGKGTAKTLKVTKASGAKITWKSSNKKVATVKKSGKYGGKVTAKATKGKAVIRCQVKKGKKTVTLKCNVTVKKKESTAKPKASAPAANVPSAPATVPAASLAPSTAPTAPGPTPDLTSNSILKRYTGIFNYMGSSLNYKDRKSVV